MTLPNLPKPFTVVKPSNSEPYGLFSASQMVAYRLTDPLPNPECAALIDECFSGEAEKDWPRWAEKAVGMLMLLNQGRPK